MLVYWARMKFRSNHALLKVKRVFSKLRIFRKIFNFFSYKQIKFNLLREESEGYAKLITEILDSQTSSNQILLVIKKLIGIKFLLCFKINFYC